MMDYTYKALLVRVIDGDSIEVDVDLGFKITARMPVRFAHINAPELNQPGGKEAKLHLTALLESLDLRIITYKPKDKYGRWLAVVYVGDMNINRQMVEDGHATAYEG